MNALSEDTGVLAPLRVGAFRALTLGRLLMYLANSVTTIALGFAVLEVTGSIVHLGLVVGARSLANVALLLFGGVLADRLPRALIMQGACGLAALSQAGLAAAVLLDAASLPLLVLLSLVNGAAAAAGLPAAAALTPQTVPAALLRPANALVRVGVQLGMTVGMSLGGAAAGLAGPGWALAGNAALFCAAGLCFALLRLPATPGPTAPAHQRGGVLRDLLEGWREFTSRSWVWSVVAQFTVVNAVISGGVVVLGTGVASSSFGSGAWGLILGLQGAGALIGGVLAARWQPRHALRFGVALILLEALPLVALAEAPHVPLLLPLMFFVGMATEQFGVAWEVSLQQNIPSDRLARVYSYDALGSFLAMPVGEMVAGPIAHRLGTDTTLLGMAALLIVATLATLAVPGVRSLARD
ncbi:MFS transporter [Marinactinospora thermotolerans]|uniref:Predicted arabinose efflux permease, MFS family n=1 Tax=Marinactinospora thermotolerans DSM 45154 TaxID=1122192 RepID=A0A1T4SGH9_9ACTN|nr:MFS transporter [Marinactinospora thermotolerans]SKA27332.1 Predicted arabinose efflux permease, MFS family [Marinactinospora thermotolerans DSM 45154]